MLLDHQKIRRVRTRLKLSQAAAAERAGMGSRQAWSSVESGRENISLERLARIAAVLCVRPKDLLK